MIDVLEDDGRDLSSVKIAGFIDAPSEDEQIDLVALMRLGRGDGNHRGMERLAAAGRGRTQRSDCALPLGEPMLGDLLAEGLGEFGLSGRRSGSRRSSSHP